MVKATDFSTQYQMIVVLEDHFCQGAKMYNQSFRLGFCGRNGSDQHRFCIGKILNQCFSP